MWVTPWSRTSGGADGGAASSSEEGVCSEKLGGDLARHLWLRDCLSKFTLVQRPGLSKFTRRAADFRSVHLSELHSLNAKYGKAL